MIQRTALATSIVVFALIIQSTPSAAQVPSFAQATGHELGERITLHHEMIRYLESLDRSSDRVRLLDQGATWEGRRLLAAIVTAPGNIARLDEIQQTALRLADPRTTTPEEAAALSEAQPVIVWYGGSIHGFELSGAEGLLKLLDHLTTRSDAATLLPGAVFAYEQRAGRGRVIALAEDPNFRAYLRGANRLFLNAVVLGPSGP